MSGNGIEVFARLRPPESIPYQSLSVEGKRILISFGDKEDAGRYTTSQYREHSFSFKHVFTQSSNQEEVYCIVGEKMVDKFLEGYNGTIFAYGQTASGKTYTIEGSPRSYDERGLAPRIIADVYKRLEERKEKEDVSLNVSFMEIYQDTAYDLLNPINRGITINTILPKVKKCFILLTCTSNFGRLIN